MSLRAQPNVKSQARKGQAASIDRDRPPSGSAGDPVQIDIIDLESMEPTFQAPAGLRMTFYLFQASIFFFGLTSNLLKTAMSVFLGSIGRKFCSAQMQSLLRPRHSVEAFNFSASGSRCHCPCPRRSIL